jgi:hypothetical protein
MSPPMKIEEFHKALSSKDENALLEALRELKTIEDPKEISATAAKVLGSWRWY